MKSIYFGLTRLIKSFPSLTAAILVWFALPNFAHPMDHIQGEMAGEVTTSSVILQSRLTKASTTEDGDVPGVKGVAKFELSKHKDFKNAFKTEWISSIGQNDYVVKRKIEGLKPGTRYYYRLIFGKDKKDTNYGPVRTFRTIFGPEREGKIAFTVITCLSYGKFHHGPRAYKGKDKHLGFPALKAVLNLEPDFLIGAGDNVYYDHGDRAKKQEELRKKWHEQFAQPRFVNLLSGIPAYWMKDDHDHRYNDSDTTNPSFNKRRPSNKLGIRTFKEQMPVTDPANPHAVTYRTHRISKDLQIWLLEGRDYRNPNRSPDGPNKTMWGVAQKKWLKQTLLQSDATFRVIISPTPMVGPDDVNKRDNHTNIKGFRHEGEAFFNWLRDKDFSTKQLFIICGDRHWQYHSIHPSGFEEFSTGALADANSRLGIKPGQKNSTDPKGLIRQLYSASKPSGGFLHVQSFPTQNGKPGSLVLTFYDENGKQNYSVTKYAPVKEEK